MNPTTHDHRTFVLLDENAGGTIMLVDEARDKFCVSVEEAIQGCRLIDTSYSLVQQIADLRDVIAAWIDERISAIQSAHLSFRADGILFVVLQKGIERDDELVSDLTELDIQIAQDENYSLLNLDVISIPGASKDAASAFLSSGNVQSYADQEGS